MIVEIWSDVMCPWCYIGKRRFEKAVAEFEAENDETVEVRFMPFLLDPTAPDTPQPVREAYIKKFGGAAAADEILDRVTSEAASEGLEFRMDIAQRVNALSAHRLLVFAETVGLQTALKERLMKAYFTEGADVGDHAVLVALGEEIGLDREAAQSWLESDQGRAEVAASLEFAGSNGLTSVPTYVFDRRVAVPGAQPSDVFSRMLTRVAETDGPAQLG